MKVELASNLRACTVSHQAIAVAASPQITEAEADADADAATLGAACANA